MHARTRLPRKIYIPIYVYISIHIYVYLYVDTYIYPVFRTRRYTSAWGHPRMGVPTRLRTRTRARIGGPATHNGPRRIHDPAERVPPAVARRRAGKAAHTQYMFDTAAVFHAPMFALNAFAEKNACEPKPHAVHADGTRSHVSARTEWAPNRKRTHTRADEARGRVCAAGPHRRSAHRGSQTRMDVDTCMHHVSIYYTSACSIDGWRCEVSASHSRTCRVLARRPRPHAIARTCKNEHAYPFTYPDFA
jgi:hypothetical protein